MDAIFAPQGVVIASDFTPRLGQGIALERAVLHRRRDAYIPNLRHGTSDMSVFLSENQTVRILVVKIY